jgi:cyclopropane fatty-acyl-phospholipid synthase-like methyltransferase
MRESGDELVARIGVTHGQKVLDLGCGDGTTALPAARRGAEVLGVDIARNLVEAGNERAVRFRAGAASRNPSVRRYPPLAVGATPLS